MLVCAHKYSVPLVHEQIKQNSVMLADDWTAGAEKYWYLGYEMFSFIQSIHG